MINRRPTPDTLIHTRLAHIHARLASISDSEAKAAWVNGYGCRGEFMPERFRLIDETDKLLDELEQRGGTLPFAYQ